MIKRIFTIGLVLICFPLLFPAVIIGLPVMVIYVGVKYVLTGAEDLDMVFAPMEWAISLPYVIIDKWL